MYIIDPCTHRHSEDMIRKLENAGLGFYVRETETHQKLGKYIFEYCVDLHVGVCVRLLLVSFSQARSLFASWCTVY